MGRIVGGMGRVVPKVTLDARAEAAALVAGARAEADAMRAQAREAREEAVRQGRAEGREQGRVEAAAELAALLADARLQTARAREASAPTAITLALKMTEQIVARAVTLAPELMAEIVGAAMDACRPRGDWVRVRVHPDDAAAVTARRDALSARAPAGAALEIVADEAVGRHGCVIETALGRVDARLETQLAALERALLEETHG
ncbi:MAG TPA: FliH/SctL family protein [Polyangia bacterium]|nr:FliH/SctL family protein [Polyangia bacterium]